MYSTGYPMIMVSYFNQKCSNYIFHDSPFVSELFSYFTALMLNLFCQRMRLFIPHTFFIISAIILKYYIDQIKGNRLKKQRRLNLIS